MEVELHTSLLHIYSNVTTPSTIDTALLLPSVPGDFSFSFALLTTVTKELRVNL